MTTRIEGARPNAGQHTAHAAPTNGDWHAVTLERGSSVLGELRASWLPARLPRGRGLRKLLAAVAQRNGIADFREIPAGKELWLPTRAAWESSQDALAAGLSDPAIEVVDTDRPSARLTRAPGDTAKASRFLRRPRGTSCAGSRSGPRRSVRSDASGRVADLVAKAEREVLVRFQTQERLEKGISALASLLGSNAIEPREVFSQVHALMRRNDNQEVLDLYREHTKGSELEADLEQALDERDFLHAMAYVRNESGRLETHDLLFFLSQGWRERFLTDWGMGLGLGTADESLKRVLYEVHPGNRHEINEKLRSHYGIEHHDPIESIVRGEHSFSTERWLAAVPHIPRDKDNPTRIPQAYERAFQASEISGIELVALLDELEPVEYDRTCEAFEFLHKKGLLKKAGAPTLLEHAKARLDPELAAALERFVSSGAKTADVQEKAAYLAKRLELLVVRPMGFDKREVMRLLTGQLGDGTDAPKFSQVSAHLSKPVRSRMLSLLPADQRKIAQIVMDKGLAANSPPALALRLTRLSDPDAICDLLKGRSAEEIARIRRAGDNLLGMGELRAHIEKTAGRYLHNVHHSVNSRIPSQALAYFDLGDPDRRQEHAAQLYATDSLGRPLLSTGAKIIYACFEPDWGVLKWSRCDKPALFAALEAHPLPTRSQVPEQVEALERLLLGENALGFTERMHEELSDADAERAVALCRPVSFRSVKEARTSAKTLAADVRAELERGLASILGLVDMERGMFEESLMEFEVAAQAIFDAAAHRGEDRPENLRLSNEDIHALVEATARLIETQATFVDEHEAIGDTLARIGLYTGSALALACPGGQGIGVALLKGAVGAAVGERVGVLVADRGPEGSQALVRGLVAAAEGAVLAGGAALGSAYRGARLAKIAVGAGADGAGVATAETIDTLYDDAWQALYREDPDQALGVLTERFAVSMGIGAGAGLILRPLAGRVARGSTRSASPRSGQAARQNNGTLPPETPVAPKNLVRPKAEPPPTTAVPQGSGTPPPETLVAPKNLVQPKRAPKPHAAGSTGKPKVSSTPATGTAKAKAQPAATGKAKADPQRTAPKNGAEPKSGVTPPKTRTKTRQPGRKSSQPARTSKAAGQKTPEGESAASAQRFAALMREMMDPAVLRKPVSELNALRVKLFAQASRHLKDLLASGRATPEDLIAAQEIARQAGKLGSGIPAELRESLQKVAELARDYAKGIPPKRLAALQRQHSSLLGATRTARGEAKNAARMLQRRVRQLEAEYGYDPAHLTRSLGSLTDDQLLILADVLRLSRGGVGDRILWAVKNAVRDRGLQPTLDRWPLWQRRVGIAGAVFGGSVIAASAFMGWVHWSILEPFLPLFRPALRLMGLDSGEVESNGSPEDLEFTAEDMGVPAKSQEAEEAGEVEEDEDSLEFTEADLEIE